MPARETTPLARRSLVLVPLFFALVLASWGAALRAIAAPPAAPRDVPHAPAAAARDAIEEARRTPPRRVPAREALADERGNAIEIFPPVEPIARAPLVVVLHATCMQPGPVCARFGRAGRDGSALVCPSGNDACAGEPDWHGAPEAKRAFLERDLALVDARYGASVAAKGGVLVGWSRGAFAARDILDATVARGEPSRFVGLVLIAAAVSHDAARLRRAGIARAVFAAGDLDGARPTMQRAAARLSAAGIPSRYVSLGPIGHWLPQDLEARMRAAIAWAAGAS
ncbi:MAG TPA: hypothetical protein VHB21_17225 [Minicystis sp.]|nr:hypothetical protein [Minicystis sp.]